MKSYHENIHYFQEVTSTNDIAKEKLDSGEDIAIIIAQFQTKGRGRLGKTWQGTPTDNIYLSIGEKIANAEAPSTPIIKQAQACIAVYKALQNQNITTTLKYPNDIYIQTKTNQKKKISGTLIETEYLGSIIKQIVTGIGINVQQKQFPPELKEIATSIYNEGFSVSKEQLIQDTLNEYFTQNEKTSKTILQEWIAILAMHGKSIEVIGSQESYTANQILSDGRLELINNSNGEKRIIDNGDSIRYEL